MVCEAARLIRAGATSLRPFLFYWYSNHMYDWLILIEEEITIIDSRAWASPVDLFTLASVVQQDPLPARPLSAAYLFGNTPDLEHSTLQKAAELHRESTAERLCICGGGPIVGVNDKHKRIAYRGEAAWKKELIAQGVPETAIVSVPRPDLTPHTGTEAQRFIELAQKNKWQSVCIVSHPIHLLRAFASTATVIVKNNLEIKLYAVPGTPEPWQEPALYSQAGETRPRIELLQGELERLNRWFAKGDLISAEETLAYLARRDAKTM